MEEQFRSTQTLPRNLHSGGQYGRSSQVRINSRRQHQVIGGPVKHGVPHTTVLPSNRSGQYGSMINISIKNSVTSPKVAVRNHIQPPAKPDRTYKSSLSRSKSFNVEASRNGTDTPPRILPYTSNLQLNRLDETPPLKSPSILASISRSNRDLLKDSRNEY